MSESKVRHLVLKRVSDKSSHLALCDEETGIPLAGLTSVKMNCSIFEGPATITATFDVGGPQGIRLVGDEPRQKVWGAKET
ncbi:hypothetical protein ACPD9D_09475 [Acinetobacter baumannii]|nr:MULTISPECIES: hypothetical protein [Acinetobacter calcoaceticus/baumannii complex]ANC38188.1 hypothetical protein Aba3207_16810 [Acinetobacter baumannii]AXX42705.1 hypothetical protein Aba9201_17765 [Acinetobacter baumannii]AXX42970.1 hypothetical protein Aba9201_19225 [Acinetobacter baumannii]AXX43096.1 hypothetical protein Aba9201_19925 [Acinetobacter baumannii]EHU2217027.1 hypothetical protein [Acinetobacter baumannii]